MDDIAISGDNVPDRVMWDIKKQIHRRLQYHKQRRYAHGTGEITGSVIKKGQLIVPNRQLKKAYDTRKSLAATTDSEEVMRLTAVLRGLIQQCKQVAAMR
jgi:hypothetical protein